MVDVVHLLKVLCHLLHEGILVGRSVLAETLLVTTLELVHLASTGSSSLSVGLPLMFGLGARAVRLRAESSAGWAGPLRRPAEPRRRAARSRFYVRSTTNIVVQLTKQ